MTCFHPLTAYQYKYRKNDNGKSLVVFDFAKVYKEFGSLWSQHVDEVKLPCGHCIGCRLSQARDWAVRICHETALYASDRCFFLTLTYNDDSIQHLRQMSSLKDHKVYYSLSKRDLQLFMKRLRKKFGSGIRFYACGEYGSLNQRPHYHVIVWNLDLPDLQLWRKDGQSYYFRSTILESLWPFGFSVVGRVSFDSACYVARYCTKKITGDMAQDHYFGRTPEFSLMSRRPGVGSRWLEKYSSDVYNYDVVIFKHLKLRPPRYYDKLFEVLHPDEMEVIKKRRKVVALSSPMTCERLQTLERSAKIRLSKKMRKIESEV